MAITVFDKIMARSLRSLARGFVWGSMGILRWKVYYHNYSNILIYQQSCAIFEKSSILG